MTTTFTKEQLSIMYQGVFDTNQELTHLSTVLANDSDDSYIDCTIERLQVLIKILEEYKLAD